MLMVARAHAQSGTREVTHAFIISMSTFIVRVELHPSDKEQSYSAVHDAMSDAGFGRIYRDATGLRFHLPSSEYCITSEAAVETIRDRAAEAAGKITSLFMILVSEASHVAIAGLVPVREILRPALPEAPVAGDPFVARAA